MKAAVLENYNAPLAIRLVELPSLGPKDVLVQVKACGLCGTDLKIVSGAFPDIPLPHIPGHEIAGEISKVGDQVAEVHIGQRVAVHFYLTCGSCRYCHGGMDSLCENLRGQLGFNLNGGMAEFVKVPVTNVIPIGNTITFPQAAILADAVATPYNALKVQAGLQEGQLLVVVGAGGLGLHAVQIAKALGARVIAVDIAQPHLMKAAELGADRVLHFDRDNIEEAIRKENQGSLADIVLDLVGKPGTIERGLEWLRPAGKLLLVGYHLSQPFSVSSRQMVSKGLKILGCRASTCRDLAEVISMVEDKKILPVVDSVLPLTEVNEAYDMLKAGKVIGRIVIEP